MTGEAEFNEVYFTDARVPDSARLGGVGDGWRVALTTLMNERVAIGAGRSTEKPSPLEPVALHLDLARKADRLGDPLVRQDIADLIIRHWVLDMVGLRIRATVAAGRVPGPEGSVAKLAGALLGTKSAAVACRLAGPAATAWEAADADGGLGHSAAFRVLQAPAAGIAGGTNEVMRNILGERVLGLPKEPQVDRDIPFKDIPV
jgi:alkylation response protein AidB-like acyl-CoA dehydrogenase